MTILDVRKLHQRRVGHQRRRLSRIAIPPTPDEVVGLFAKGTAQDVDAAAAAAAAAFPAGAATSGPGARQHPVSRPPTSWTGSSSQLAAEMTREEGKTLPEAKGEVRRAINIFRYFAGEGSRMPGMLVPSERDRVHMFAMRKPIGVVGLITPWNFPSAIPAWKLAPALICGNTVVLKPASAAPLSAWRIVEALHEAGIPKGVVNFVAGSGGELGEALVDAKPLKAISFTGSCEIGDWLHAEASQAPPAHSARNGRQESHHRAGRCRFQLRGGERGQRRLLLHRPEMHRHQPRHRRRRDLRQVRRRAGRAHQEAQGRRRHAARHRHRPVRRPGADGDRAATTSRSASKEARRAACAAATGSPAARYDKGYFVEPTIFAGRHRRAHASRRKKSSDRCWP